MIQKSFGVPYEYPTRSYVVACCAKKGGKTVGVLSMSYYFRPLRIGWCIKQNDIEAFRSSARLAWSLWGGRYCPMIPIDDGELADELVRLFRIDCLHGLSGSKAEREFIERHEHLPWPSIHNKIFAGGNGERKFPTIVDLSHPIKQFYQDQVPNHAKTTINVTQFEWAASDPLTDVFLSVLGQVPPAEDTGRDYRDWITKGLSGKTANIGVTDPFPELNVSNITLSSLNRYKLREHYEVRNYWDAPGLYVGSAASFDDLLSFWNLRAAGVPLLFYDNQYKERMRSSAEGFLRHLEATARPTEDGSRIAIWFRDEAILPDLSWIKHAVTKCQISNGTWNGLNLKAPIMYFGEGSSLASTEERNGATSVTLPLNDQPFDRDPANHSQKYVVSVSGGWGVTGGDDQTLQVPFLPELNSFLSREMRGSTSGVRSEPNSIGFVKSAAEETLYFDTLDVSRLIAAVFETVGVNASISKAGIVCRNVIAQMGGLDSCRVFKVKGVRELIRRHSHNSSFSRADAMQTISAKDTKWPLMMYDNLYIEQRPIGSPLTSDSIFSFLLKKRVFRAGLKFLCEKCGLHFWVTLDHAKSTSECEFCGQAQNIEPQLRDKGWAFRTSGLFGRNDDQEGAIPVILTLQQLVRSVGFNRATYATSLDLETTSGTHLKCETDFVLIGGRSPDQKIQIAIGECKSHGTIDESDVRNLLKIADRFPPNIFSVFIVLSKLSDFSNAEVELARGINRKHEDRVIMFTERELEPYLAYERTKQEFIFDDIVVDLGGFARATRKVYLDPKPKGQA